MSKEVTSKYPDIDWDNIRKLRNDVAHIYEKVDHEMMWETITEKLPKLRDACNDILCELERS